MNKSTSNRLKIALVFPTTIKKDSFFGFCLPSLGLERLGGAVENIAECQLFDARFEKNIVKEILIFKPDLIAFNIKTTMYSEKAYQLGKKIREAMSDVIIISGGLHATACPEEALVFSNFVLRGEGEINFKKFVTGLSENKENFKNILNIPGLVYRNDQNKIIFNQMSEPVQNLDILAPPARYLRKPHYNYSASGLIKMDHLETSRGCTHACTFCSSGSVYPHKYRVHSPEYVFDEIKILAESGVKYCMLTDDHFGGDLKRTEKICDLIIESGIKIAFFCFIRPFMDHIEIKKKMVAAGFVLLSYGAESPKAEQLKRYKKGYPEGLDFVKKINAQWLEAGACYVGNSFVFGDIMDDRATMASLGNYARWLDPTYIEPLYAQPYPNTPYRSELKKNNLLIENRSWKDFTESTLLVKHPEINEHEMKILRARMWLNFFSPRKIAGVFRVPLYFKKILKLPTTTILKYMHTCDYSIFGCILENKIYRDMQIAMTRDYFRKHLTRFEESELDMTENFDDFTDMFGIKWLKKYFNNKILSVNIRDGKNIISCLRLTLEHGAIVNVCLKPASNFKKNPDYAITVSLVLLSYFIGSNKKYVKIISFVMILFYSFFRFFADPFLSPQKNG